MTVTLECPTALPVTHLSYSSLRKFEQCPELWRREYLDGEKAQPGHRAIIGSGLHKGVELYFQSVIDGTPLEASDIQDAYATTIRDRKDESFEPGAVDEAYDAGLEAISTYMRDIAPSVTEPKSVERRFSFALAPNIEWTIDGYIDLEHGPGPLGDSVADYKLVSKALSQNVIDISPQPSIYVAARLTEGVTTREVAYQQIKQLKTKSEGVVITTQRSDRQVQLTLERFARAARAIEHAAYTGDWHGAPDGAWWCGQGNCRHFGSCPLV